MAWSNPTRAQVRAAGTWLLIDLDATAALGTGFVGLKHSTAYDPPELLYREAPNAAAETHRVLADGSGLHFLADGTILHSPPARATGGTTTAVKVSGGAGFRVRAVDDGGKALDPRAAGVMEGLRASVSFDMWSFGCLLYEMLMRMPVWMCDTDSNLGKPEEYAQLGEWSEAAAKALVQRVPDRWAQALLLRLLSPDPQQRPHSMAEVLGHQFFSRSEEYEAPELGEGLNSHAFLSHFQGNAGTDSRRWLLGVPCS